MRIRTRLTHNIDLTDFTTVYGVQVNRGNGWAHVVRDGALFTTTCLREANEMRADMRRRAKERQQ
jgi:hypothetical protein